MLLLTEDAGIVCTHLDMGRVSVTATQDLVTIERRRVMVERDPEGRLISGCPNTSGTTWPCASTLTVTTGYSAELRIQGRRVCLDTVTGFTNGAPPGEAKYEVRQAGQSFVSER